MRMIQKGKMKKNRENRENKEKVLEYRNQEDVRKWMITDEKISIKNHLVFINNLKKSTDKYYFAAFLYLTFPLIMEQLLLKYFQQTQHQYQPFVQ